MPRGQAPKIRFGKSQRTPSERQQAKRPNSFKMPMNKPKGQREITDFAEEAAQDGVSTAEAIHQFQEEECYHVRDIEIANGPTRKVYRCTTCGRVKAVEKK